MGIANIAFVRSLRIPPLIGSVAPALSQVHLLERAIEETQRLKVLLAGGQNAPRQAQRVLEALSAVREGVIPREDLEAMEQSFSRDPSSIRRLIDKIDGYVSRLSTRMGELTLELKPDEEYAAREYVLAVLSRITGRERAASGTTADHWVRPAKEDRPSWARDLRWNWLSRDPDNEYPAYLDDEFNAVIGSGERVNLVIAGTSVSLRHCKITFREGNYAIEDLGSRSGTFVNGTPVAAGKKQVLKTGDKIRFGEKEEIRIILPLQRLSHQIARAASSDELLSLLLENGEKKYAEEILKNPPEEGGLRGKVEEFLLEEEFASLHARRLPGVSPKTAFSLFGTLAGAVQVVGSADEMFRALCGSLIPYGFDLSDEICEFLSSGGYRSFSQVSELCGIRPRLEELTVQTSLRPEDERILKSIGLDPAEFLERPWKKIQIPEFSALGRDFEKIKERILRGIGPADKESFPREALGIPLEGLAQVILGEPAPGEPEISGELPSRPFDGRVFFSLDPDHTDEVWKDFIDFFHRKAENQRLSIQLHKHFSSVSLLFRSQAQNEIKDLVLEFYRSKRSSFKESRSLFSHSLLDNQNNEMIGVSFAQEPTGQNQDFVQLRTGAFSRALRLLTIFDMRGEPLPWDLFFQAFAFFLDRAEIDLENPSLQKGGMRRFATFLKPPTD